MSTMSAPLRLSGAASRFIAGATVIEPGRVVGGGVRDPAHRSTPPLIGVSHLLLKYAHELVVEAAKGRKIVRRTELLNGAGALVHRVSTRPDHAGVEPAKKRPIRVHKLVLCALEEPFQIMSREPVRQLPSPFSD